MDRPLLRDYNLNVPRPLILPLILIASCAGAPTPRPGPRRTTAAPACHESDPRDIYVKVALCLDAPTTGRFSLSERQAVPDATLSRTCQGRYHREASRIVLEVEGCDHRTVGEQRGEVSGSREMRRQTLEATPRPDGALLVRTTWGQDVVVRR